MKLASQPQAITGSSSSRAPKRRRSGNAGSGWHIAESAHPNNTTTCSVRNDFYLTNSPDTALSQTWAQESTLRDRDCYPFWNVSCEAEYRKWWLPVRTDCVVSHSSSWPGSASDRGHRSWFSIREISHQTRSSPRTSWPSCRYSLVDGTGRGVTEDSASKTPISHRDVARAFPTRCRKIRAFPTGHQRHILRNLVGGCRKLYNETVAMMRDRRLPFASEAGFEEAERQRGLRFNERKRAQAEEAGTPFVEVPYKGTMHPWLDKVYMKNFLVPEGSEFVKASPYVKDIPKETRQQAVEDAIEACKAALSNKAVGNITGFRMGFRKKKDPRWSLAVAFNAASGSRFWPRKIKSFGELKVAEPRHLRVRYGRELKISKDQLGRYWMVVMNEKGPGTQSEDASRGVAALSKLTRENQAGDKPVASIDPGVRTRHAIYMTDGRVVEVGNQDIQRIVRLCRHVDRCVSALKKGTFEISRRHCTRFPGASVMELFAHYRPAKKVQGLHVVVLDGEARNRIRQKMHHLKARIESLKNEIDDQTVSYLLRECKTVLLPPFDTHSMATRLNHKTARAMMQWRHGTFKAKLLERAPSRGVRVMIVPEAYTSKTCGACG
jgi:putative transposase